MDSDSMFEVDRRALLDNWGSRPCTSHEARALALLHESNATSKAWDKLKSRKPPGLKPNFQQEVLRSILKSFDQVEGDGEPQTLLRIDEEFKKVEQALDILINYFGHQAGVDPSTVKVDEACRGSQDRQSIWQLRQMQHTIRIRCDLDISSAASTPIVSSTQTLADRALNFACCLAEHIDVLSGRPYLDFSIAITEILYGGVAFVSRTLDNHRKQRKLIRSSAFKRRDLLFSDFNIPIDRLDLASDSKLHSVKVSGMRDVD